MSAGGPDPIDVAIGARLKQQRTALGMTMPQLGNAIGVTYQQIQKYERGMNRMASSNLVRAAKALQVPMAYFFENIEGGGPPLAGRSDFSAAAADIARDFMTIKDKDVQRTLAKFLQAVARSQDKPAED